MVYTIGCHWLLTNPRQMAWTRIEDEAPCICDNEHWDDFDIVHN